MANDSNVLDPPDIDDADGAGETEAEAASVGAMPQPSRARGGRPKGSRNRATVEREQTGVGAAPAAPAVTPSTSRPAGRSGHFPGEDGKIPVDADLLWMHVLEEIQAQGFSPYDMEIRVDRQTPPPGGPIATIEASAVQGDAQTSPATALRNYVIDWIHLPAQILGPAVYTLHFCWRNKAQFFRRGELRVPQRSEILAMKQSDAVRHAQSGGGVAGVGAAPQYVYPPPAPQQAAPPQPQPPPPWQQYGFGAPPQQAPTQAPFDAEAERARIRMEVERDYEMRELRRELDDLRRRPQQQQQQYAQQYAPPPQQQRRGAGAPPQYAPPQYETEDERTARVVVQVLQQTGVIPRAPAVGVGGSPAIAGAVAAASGLGDDFERAMDTVTRGKKVFKKMKELFEDDEEAPPKKQATGVGAPAEEDEEATPKIRFQKTNQRWKDGREVMMPIDQKGEPILPTTLPSIMATGFANPYLLEPLAAGVGAVMQRMASMGLGAQPQTQRADIQVQQQPQQQPQPQPQLQQAAPPPVPYAPAPQAAPAAGDDWNLT